MMPDKIKLQNMHSLADMHSWVSDAYDAAMTGNATPQQQRKLAQSFFTLSMTMQLDAYETAQNAIEEPKSDD